MNSEIYIIIGGIYTLGFLIFHLLFWKVFNWKKGLRLLNEIDKSTMQVLNISLTFVFFIFSYISIFYPDDLISTDLGLSIIILISIFWFFRSIVQIYFYGLTNKFSLILFSIFICGGILYLIPYLSII